MSHQNAVEVLVGVQIIADRVWPTAFSMTVKRCWRSARSQNLAFGTQKARFYDMRAAQAQTRDVADGLRAVAQLEATGFSRKQVQRFVARGELLRIDRGVYAPADFEPTEHHHLALVALKSPRAVIALTSAAAFHRLGTQVPHEVWIALPPKQWVPQLESVTVRAARFSGSRLLNDVEEHRIEGVRVRVYGIPKTVVDLFRYRNKLGTDVVVEAMRETLAARRTSVAEIARIARRDGVYASMLAYLESMQ